MNRHLKVSLTLATLSLTTVGLLTGCNSTTDLETKVDNNQAEIQGSLRDSIKKAETELATAKTELQTLVQSGDDVNAQELTKKISELTAAIEAAKKVASDADAASKAELLAAIETAKAEAESAALKSLQAAQTELEEAIVTGDLATAESISKELDVLEQAIENAKKLASDNNAALKEELLAAVEAVKKDAADAVADTIDQKTAELEQMVNAGDTAVEEKLQAQIIALNNAIEIAKLFATDASNAVKDELLDTINASKKEASDAIAKSVDNVNKELTAKIEAGELKSAEDLKAAMAEVDAVITATQKLTEDADALLLETVNDSIAQLRNEVSAEIKDAINVAIAELTVKVESGDEKSASDLAIAVKDMTDAVEAAKVFASESDATLRSDLEDSFASSLESLSNALMAKYDELVIDFNKKLDEHEIAADEALASEVAALVDLIEAAKVAAEEANAADKAEVLGAIEVAKAELLASAQTALDEAVADLNAKIQAGDVKSAEDLTAAVNAINATIESVKSMVADGDNALRLEFADTLTKAIKDAVDTAVAELNAKIDAGQEADSKALAEAAATLNAAIEAAKTFATEADAESKAELETLVSTTRLEVLEVIESKVTNLKSEIEAAMAENKTELTNKLTELENFIVATEAAFADADEALKTELKEFVVNTKSEILDSVAADLAAQKEELLAEIAAGDKANDQKISDVKVALEGKIQDLTDAIALLKQQDLDFHTKFDSLHQDLKAAIQAVDEASMHLANWNGATDSLVGKDGGLAKLKELFRAYEAKKTTYVDGDFVKVEDLYEEYWVRLIRSSDADEVVELLGKFDTLASEIRTIPDTIYDAIMEVGATIDDVEYDADKEGLDKVKFLIDEAVALGNGDVLAHILAYSDDAIDLVALYDSYVDQYNALLRKSNGQAIKDRMDALLSSPIIWSTDVDVTSTSFILQSIRTDVDVWLSDVQNALEHVDGFADTYDAFVEAEARWVALAAAKTEADLINQDIEQFTADVTESGATIHNFIHVEALKSRYQNWMDTYFSAPYDSEIGVTENYAMVDHEAYDALLVLFEQRVDSFKAAASVFANKVDAIGDVNLMSWDEINSALAEYGTLVISRDLNDFNYLFNETDTPASYYDKLVRLYAEYRNLKTEAHDAYVSVFAPVDGIVVSIYDGEKIEALMNWYATYGVKDADGNYTFDNGESGTGYILSDDLTVDTADYEAAVALRDAFETLTNAKAAEIADVEAKIDAIGTVTVARGDYIAEVYADYLALVDGQNAPDGFIAEQYKLVDGYDLYIVSNLDVLDAAREQLADLEAELEDVKRYIEAMDAKTTFTDFADFAEYEAYIVELATARQIIADFVTNNNGSDEGYLVAEYAKLDAGELAVVKYDQASRINEVADQLIADVNVTDIEDADKTYLMSVIDTVRLETLGSIDGAIDVEGVDAAVELGKTKFDHIVAGVVTYDKYVDALRADYTLDDATKADLAFKMSLSFANTLDRVIESDNIDDVILNAKFVEDELESLYSLPKYE